MEEHDSTTMERTIIAILASLDSGSYKGLRLVSKETYPTSYKLDTYFVLWHLYTSRSGWHLKVSLPFWSFLERVDLSHYYMWNQFHAVLSLFLEVFVPQRNNKKFVLGIPWAAWAVENMTPERLLLTSANQKYLTSTSIDKKWPLIKWLCTCLFLPMANFFITLCRLLGPIICTICHILNYMQRKTMHILCLPLFQFK